MKTLEATRGVGWWGENRGEGGWVGRGVIRRGGIVNMVVHFLVYKMVIYY